MAHKRMFSQSIVASDAFLDMPLSSQLLYFHMGMEADDDGFVANPKKVMRMVGCQDDDFRVLIGKKFIITFSSGICVVKHWKINNYIRSDRYIPTLYKEEMLALEIKENNGYKRLTTTGVPKVGKGLTEYSKEENSIVKKSKEQKNPHGEFKNVLLTIKEYKSVVSLMGEENTLELIEELSDYLESKGKRYKSHYATLRSWYRRKQKETKPKKISIKKY